MANDMFPASLALTFPQKEIDDSILTNPASIPQSLKKASAFMETNHGRKGIIPEEAEFKLNQYLEIERDWYKYLRPLFLEFCNGRPLNQILAEGGSKYRIEVLKDSNTIMVQITRPDAQFNDPNLSVGLALIYEQSPSFDASKQLPNVIRIGWIHGALRSINSNIPVGPGIHTKLEDGRWSYRIQNAQTGAFEFPVKDLPGFLIQLTPNYPGGRAYLPVVPVDQNTPIPGTIWNLPSEKTIMYFHYEKEQNLIKAYKFVGLGTPTEHLKIHDTQAFNGVKTDSSLDRKLHAEHYFEWTQHRAHLFVFDGKNDHVYEGEVGAFNGKIVPHGKGVWKSKNLTKSGVFNENLLSSGFMESNSMLLTFDKADPVNSAPAHLFVKKLLLHMTGNYKMSDFVGPVKMWTENMFYYEGDKHQTTFRGKGKLWSFATNQILEGDFTPEQKFKGKIITFHPEPKIPYQKGFPTYTDDNIFTTYEGSSENWMYEGSGKLFYHPRKMTVEGNFRKSVLYGKFLVTLADGTKKEHEIPESEATQGISNQLLEDLYLQSAKTGSGPEKPDNKSNMMNKDKDWTLAEGWDAGRIPLQGGSGASSASFGMRLPFGFHSIWMNRMGALVNTQQQGLRSVVSRPLMTPNSSILTGMRQPLLRFVCRRFK